MQQKIQQTLDSDSEEDNEDDNDINEDTADPIKVKEESVDEEDSAPVEETNLEETPEEEAAVPENINELNLVEKFASMNLCRLCYANVEGCDVKKHEESEHADDK